VAKSDVSRRHSLPSTVSVAQQLRKSVSNRQSSSLLRRAAAASSSFKNDFCVLIIITRRSSSLLDAHRHRHAAIIP
jgi:hypothetical protein